MRDSFLPALGVVRFWEGGLVDHPRDPGGITNLGVSLRFLRAIGLDINGDGVVDRADIIDIAPADVAKLFRRHFWDRLLCDQLPAGIDVAVFDCGVNQGNARSARILQKCLKVKADGVIGPVTVAAARAHVDPTTLLRDFMARRAVHYSGLRNVVVFGLGWFRRLFDVHRIALKMENS